MGKIIIKQNVTKYLTMLSILYLNLVGNTADISSLVKF